jgi:hypothetical protein
MFSRGKKGEAWKYLNYSRILKYYQIGVGVKVIGIRKGCNRLQQGKKDIIHYTLRHGEMRKFRDDYSIECRQASQISSFNYYQYPRCVNERLVPRSLCLLFSFPAASGLAERHEMRFCTDEQLVPSGTLIEHCARAVMTKYILLPSSLSLSPLQQPFALVGTVSIN